MGIRRKRYESGFRYSNCYGARTSVTPLAASAFEQATRLGQNCKVYDGRLNIYNKDMVLLMADMGRLSMPVYLEAADALYAASAMSQQGPLSRGPRLSQRTALRGSDCSALGLNALGRYRRCTGRGSMQRYGENARKNTRLSKVPKVLDNFRKREYLRNASRAFRVDCKCIKVY